MYQRKVINNHKTIIFHQQYFTYQRKGNHELQIQALNAIVDGLQTQMNNLSSGNGGGGSGGGEIGTMQN